MYEYLFIINALLNGWKVSHNNGKYTFKRKHNNEIKYFKDNYIFLFIKENLKKKI